MLTTGCNYSRMRIQDSTFKLYRSPRARISLSFMLFGKAIVPIKLIHFIKQSCQERINYEENKRNNNDELLKLEIINRCYLMFAPVVCEFHELFPISAQMLNSKAMHSIDLFIFDFYSCIRMTHQTLTQQI